MPASKATYQGFIAFVHSQADHKPICHDNWHVCSVGDYLRSVDIVSDNTNYSAGIFAECIIQECNELLYILLNDAGFGHIDTYGELSHLINNPTLLERVANE